MSPSDFYRRQPTDLADYLRAAWRYRHRAALGEPRSTLASVAAETRVSPTYLDRIWKTLNAPGEKVGPIAALQAKWNSLPPPKSAVPHVTAKRDGGSIARSRTAVVVPQEQASRPASRAFVQHDSHEAAIHVASVVGSASSQTRDQSGREGEHEDGWPAGTAPHGAVGPGHLRVVARIVSAGQGEAGAARPQAGVANVVIRPLPNGMASQSAPRQNSVPQGAGRYGGPGEDEVRAECEAIRDWAIGLRMKLASHFDNLRVPRGFSSGGQCFVLWKDEQYATHRSTLNPAGLQFGGVPATHTITQRRFGQRRQQAPPAQTVTDPVDPDLFVPEPAAERAPYMESFERFCSVIPDAFYISERGRMFVDEPGDRGRLLTAGLHNSMGVFRDDQPLMELILDENGRRELDHLWQDFDMVAFIPERMHAEFFVYERAEAGTITDTEFNFARAEDKEALTDGKIKLLGDLYLAKAKRNDCDAATEKAIVDHFAWVSKTIRGVERERVAAEPVHVRSLLDFAQRAYRRPLSEAERADLVAFYQGLRQKEGLTHEEAIRDSIVRVLMSPNFLFRLDLDGDMPSAAKPTTGPASRPTAIHAAPQLHAATRPASQGPRHARTEVPEGHRAERPGATELTESSAGRRKATGFAPSQWAAGGSRTAAAVGRGNPIVVAAAYRLADQSRRSARPAKPSTPPAAAPGLQPLPDYALASRLSYFLWASMPDRELLAHAAADDLHRPDVLIAQARRMLRDPKARALAVEFGGNWLDFRRFEEHNAVDRSRFPAFTDALREAMYEEPIHYLEDTFENDRSVLDLLYGKRTFVNAPLARYYGMTGLKPGADTWVRVDDADKYGRGGLLPMAVFLTKNSPGLRTSPVKRGYWVVKRVLGEVIPPPPATVPALPSDESKMGDLTLRQALAAHRANPACAACHARFDSYGLVFEGYGPVGELRTKDLGGKPIDARAPFPGGPDRSGVAGLQDFIRQKRQKDFIENFDRKLLSYALGRGLQPSDEPLLQTMETRLAKADYRFDTLVDSIVTSRQFCFRRASMAVASN